MEHVFAVVKRLRGFIKVRYRGLGKNANCSFVALGLANLYLARTRLAGKVRPEGALEAKKASQGNPKWALIRSISGDYGKIAFFADHEACGRCLISVALSYARCRIT